MPNAQERERFEEARWLAQPTTPKSERVRASYGSLIMQINSAGLCQKPKCVRKAYHQGECYPKG